LRSALFLRWDITITSNLPLADLSGFISIHTTCKRSKISPMVDIWNFETWAFTRWITWNTQFSVSEFFYQGKKMTGGVLTVWRYLKFSRHAAVKCFGITFFLKVEQNVVLRIHNRNPSFSTCALLSVWVLW
jgi:hypothetical protein